MEMRRVCVCLCVCTGSLSNQSRNVSPCSSDCLFRSCLKSHITLQLPHCVLRTTTAGVWHAFNCHWFIMKLESLENNTIQWISHITWSSFNFITMFYLDRSCLVMSFMQNRTELGQRVSTLIIPALVTTLQCIHVLHKKTSFKVTKSAVLLFSGKSAFQ